MQWIFTAVERHCKVYTDIVGVGSFGQLGFLELVQKMVSMCVSPTHRVQRFSFSFKKSLSLRLKNLNFVPWVICISVFLLSLLAVFM